MISVIRASNIYPPAILKLPPPHASAAKIAHCVVGKFSEFEASKYPNSHFVALPQPSLDADRRSPSLDSTPSSVDIVDMDGNAYSREELLSLLEPNDEGRNYLHEIVDANDLTEVLNICIAMQLHLMPKEIVERFDQQEREGYTPLHLAIMRKRMLIASALLQHGASADVQDSAKYTSLHYACAQKNLSLVKYMCEHGRADPFIKGELDDSAVVMAVCADAVEILHYFCRKFDRKKILEDKGVEGMGLLHYAAAEGSTKMIQALRKFRCGLDALHRMPIHHAISHHRTDVLELLTSPEIIKQSGLHGMPGIEIYAVTFGNAATIRKLYQLGFDFSKKIKGGITLAHIAALNNNREILKCFDDLGVPLDAPDDKGKKPIDYMTQPF